MNNKRILKIYIIIISLLLVIGINYFVFFNDNKQTNKICKEMQGVRFSKDTHKFIENVSVFINGRMEKSSANRFTFQGEIYLSNLEHSKVNDSLLVYGNVFEKKRLEGRGIITYVRNIIVNGNVNPDFAMVNWVNTDSNFSYLILADYEDDCINNPSGDSIQVYQGNDILVFPAKDVESALKLMKRYNINQDIFRKTSSEDDNPIQKSH